ncbi:MAG TPA: Type 1 glutamine amidotransferase-like domain-containing protein [Longimicrobium sp.]|nr:Type 1 glutamine amidotransferase-like domain-containing protein [Longimicrobium sp.]
MSENRIYTGPISLVAEPKPAQLAPLFLLADSQLLFWGDEDGLFIDRVAAYTGPGAPRAAYLGASNGDDPDFYGLFVAAMEGIGPAECRMIPAVPSDEDRAFLERADLVLLAGGDVERGWRAFEASGVRELVEQRYHAGAVLIGVSAGAVQLGTSGWPEGDPDAPFPTWGLVPFVVDAHAEDQDWAALRTVVRARDEGARGMGIPRGAGLVYHPDGSVEAVRHPVEEVSVSGGTLVQAMILPPTGAER